MSTKPERFENRTFDGDVTITMDMKGGFDFQISERLLSVLLPCAPEQGQALIDGLCNALNDVIAKSLQEHREFLQQQARKN